MDTTTTTSSKQELKHVKKITKEKLIQKSFVSNLSDYIVEKIFFIFGILSVLVLGLIVFYLVKEGSMALREIGIMEFITGTRWYPGATEPGFGALQFIISSLMVTTGALVIAIPWGILTAIFIAEIAPKKIKEILKPIVEIFAIFPSVVLGFIALVILSPIIAEIFNLSRGLTALTASLILSVMALPTVISISEDSINSVPREYKEAAIALGASKWEMIKLVSLPAAKSGIVAAIMLGFGRAIGETMTVLMAAGNAIDMPLTQFLGVVVPDFLTSVRTLTATIAIGGSDAPWGSIHFSALFVVALILFVITFAVNLIADLLINRQRGALRND